MKGLGKADGAELVGRLWPDARDFDDVLVFPVGALQWAAQKFRALLAAQGGTVALGGGGEGVARGRHCCLYLFKRASFLLRGKLG